MGYSPCYHDHIAIEIPEKERRLRISSVTAVNGRHTVHKLEQVVGCVVLFKRPAECAITVNGFQIARERKCPMSGSTRSFRPLGRFRHH